MKINVLILVFCLIGFQLDGGASCSGLQGDELKRCRGSEQQMLAEAHANRIVGISLWHYCYGCARYKVTFDVNGNGNLIDGSRDMNGKINPGDFDRLFEAVRLLAGQASSQLANMTPDAPQSGIIIKRANGETHIKYLDSQKPSDFKKAEKEIKAVVSNTRWAPNKSLKPTAPRLP